MEEIKESRVNNEIPLSASSDLWYAPLNTIMVTFQHFKDDTFKKYSVNSKMVIDVLQQQHIVVSSGLRHNILCYHEKISHGNYFKNSGRVIRRLDVRMPGIKKYLTLVPL